MSELLKLAEKCIEAEGPSRELDAKLGAAVGWWIGLNDDPGSWELPPYTASIDAALTLAPAGWRWEISNNAIDRGIDRCVPPNDTYCEVGPWALLERPSPEDEDANWFGVQVAGSGGKTTALALCAAALKARDAERQKPSRS